LGIRRERDANERDYVGRSRSGRFVVGRKTQGERIRKKLKALSGRLAALRTLGGKAMLEYVRRHLQGHLQYFGVSGNFRSLKQYVYHVARRLYKWLNRRSQRRSVAWNRFHQVVVLQLPRPRIIHDLYPTLPWMTQTGSRME
jgi:hypothetical protein